MDPLTAFVNVTTAMLTFITKIVDSQPPEVQRQLWEWYVKDIKWWREFLKIDKVT